MRVTTRTSSRLLALGAVLIAATVGSTARATDDPRGAEARSPAPDAATTTTAPASADAVEWTLSAAAGPVIVGLEQPSASPWPPAFGASGVAWQVELQRRSRNEPFLMGAALEGTHDQSGGPQLLGAHAFAGTTWRHRHWDLEATIGLGVEAAQILQADLTYQLGIYAQGALVAAVPISGALEGVVRLGVHLTATHDEDWFAASTIGVRYTLP